MQARHNAILSLPAYRGTRIADHRQGVCPGVEAPSQTTGDHRRQRLAKEVGEHRVGGHKTRAEPWGDITTGGREGERRVGGLASRCMWARSSGRARRPERSSVHQIHPAPGP